MLRGPYPLLAILGLASVLACWTLIQQRDEARQEAAVFEQELADCQTSKEFYQPMLADLRLSRD